MATGAAQSSHERSFLRTPRLCPVRVQKGLHRPYPGKLGGVLPGVKNARLGCNPTGHLREWWRGVRNQTIVDRPDTAIDGGSNPRWRNFYLLGALGKNSHEPATPLGPATVR